MTIAGQDILTLIVVALISFMAGAVKTILAYTRDKIFPKKLDFIVNIILSFFVGILAGFACTYFNIVDGPLYIIVAVASLSAERILSTLPTIFVKKIEDAVGVKPSQEEYERDPVNKK